MSVDDRPWRSAAALVYVEDVADPVLDPDDLHHLRRVLRLRAGDAVCVGDGRGGVRPAVLSGSGALECTAAPRFLEPPPSPVTLGVAPPKGDRLDLLVGRSCELGVDRILLFTAGRSVVRWDGDRADRALERLRRVIRSAGAQSRRPWLPEVALGSLEDLIRSGAPIADLDGRLPEPGDRVLLVGPEGGWTESERAAADAGAGRVRLATDVLRVETAAVAAVAALTLGRLR